MIEEINDLKMENMIEELKDFKADKERLIDICRAKITEYTEKIDSYEMEIKTKEELIKEKLFGMVERDKMKITKTEYNYKLPSGKIFIKKDKLDIKLKKNYNESEIPENFIKIEKSVKWGEFKKILKIEDENVINIKTGEILESVEIEVKKGGKLDIKL